MEPLVTAEDKKVIFESIRNKYIKVASSPEGQFKFPTGRAGLKALNYEPDMIGALPDTVLDSYCGVGNPFLLGPVNRGEAVLDFGCGAGVDTIIAAMMVGPEGTATGVDIIPEMLLRAEENLKLTNHGNVGFKRISGEKLSFEDGGFDVVISNGAINLVPDKTSIMEEILRVLKPGGRLMIADQILLDTIQIDKENRVKSWFQ